MKELMSLHDYLLLLEDVIDNDDGLRIERCVGLVMAEYVRIGRYLPLENAWRWGKGKDAFGGLQDVDTLAGKLTFSHSFRALLYLMTSSADLGRLVIAAENTQGDTSRKQNVHGEASVEVLNELKILNQFREGGLSIGLAIKHHSDIETPTLKDFNGNETAWLLCCLLRDLDKLSIISGKAFLYVEDPNETKRQLVANHLEMHYEVTEEILEQFERGQPIDRLKCKTFPDWLLQFLAWRGDFNFQETWDMAVESRGYYFVLRWLKKHFELERMTQMFRKMSGIKPSGIELQLARILAAAREQYGLSYDLD